MCDTCGDCSICCSLPLYSLVTAVSFYMQFRFVICVALMQSDLFFEFTWVESGNLGLTLCSFGNFHCVHHHCSGKAVHASVNCSHTVLVLLLFILLLNYGSVSYSICCSGEAVYASVYCSPTRVDLLIDVPIDLNWFALYLPLSDFFVKGSDRWIYIWLSSNCYLIIIASVHYNGVWIRLTRVLFSFEFNSRVRPRCYRCFCLTSSQGFITLTFG